MCSFSCYLGIFYPYIFNSWSYSFSYLLSDPLPTLLLFLTRLLPLFSSSLILWLVLIFSFPALVLYPFVSFSLHLFLPATLLMWKWIFLSFFPFVSLYVYIYICMNLLFFYLFLFLSLSVNVSVSFFFRPLVTTVFIIPEFFLQLHFPFLFLDFYCSFLHCLSLCFLYSFLTCVAHHLVRLCLLLWLFSRIRWRFFLF